MAINNVMKLITTIMVLELIVIAAQASTHNYSGYDHTDFVSVTCVADCRALCKGKGWWCFTKCIFKCKDVPVVSEDVPVCTSNCAQSKCSKFVGSDTNMLEKCVINDCAKDCISRSGN
ncbi:hypothetical protein POM88_011362 [Heracleum sosnowskyi]|uniref:Transmembrane protein n=1 Tax=Heracleum sosnowskyi TaxID=360622 RepID=A0AAD8IWV0_9APIA|nr:hypothetical protein POM88_011362 [Heracleum sosnowskyi]